MVSLAGSDLREVAVFDGYLRCSRGWGGGFMGHWLWSRLVGTAEQCSALREAAQPVLVQGDQAESN
jgi:hypothetical protein